ncbi:MAG: FKBP-type peptidyl-prolyl cis-trans isomerase [Rikenellaceae bacterium]|nr:FKBP-type peptidyl-prolyl cis-trans isomerase [Rikenellaceae bacterium]
MKILYRYILLTALSLLAVCCNSEEKNTVATQETNIENFLSNYLDEDEIRPLSSGVYRYIPRSGSGSRIIRGDVVCFYFAGYQFTSSRQEPAFYTNFDYLVEEMREDGINTIFWSTDPEVVTIGDNRLIKALETGLTGCNKGDSVRLFVTSDNAYGDHYVSNLPINTAVEYVINILTEEEESNLILP